MLEGEPLVSRFKYREKFSNFLNSARDIVGKEMNKQKELDLVSDSIENIGFGFKCLSYSVNESSGFIEIVILNKRKTPGTVSVRTMDKTAKAGKDY